MTDSEFNELIGHLHRQSGLDGDLGHEYWTRVIRQLREMRTLAQSAVDGKTIDATRAAILDLLGTDIAAHPERLQAINPQYVARLRDLVAGVDVDLNSALPAQETALSPAKDPI